MGDSVCIRTVRGAVMTAAVCGLPPDRALEQLGIEASLLADPAARVPHAVFARAWTELPSLCGDPAFGLRAARLSSQAPFDVIDYAIAHCRTMREAGEQLIRYQRLIHEATEVTFQPDPGGVWITQRLRVPGPMPPSLCDFIIGELVLRSATMTGGLGRPRRLELARPAPASLDEHRRFFDCPLLFDAPRNAVCFEPELLDLPVVQADASLGMLMRNYADELLARLPAPSTLRDELGRHLVGILAVQRPDLDEAARALGLSARSLQRKLEAEGSSFRAVLDDARQRVAMGQVREGKTVSEVAFLLGFSEVAAFSRAFRRWTGKSPVEFRRGA